MDDHTDLYDEPHQVEAALNGQWGRVVYYDLDPYTPDQARALAHDLLAAADALTNTLIGLPGGGA